MPQMDMVSLQKKSMEFNSPILVVMINTLAFIKNPPKIKFKVGY